MHSPSAAGSQLEKPWTVDGVELRHADLPRHAATEIVYHSSYPLIADGCERMKWLAIVLAACGAGSQPAPTAPVREVTRKPVSCGALDMSGAPDDTSVFGGICDDRSGEWRSG